MCLAKHSAKRVAAFGMDNSKFSELGSKYIEQHAASAAKNDDELTGYTRKSDKLSKTIALRALQIKSGIQSG